MAREAETPLGKLRRSVGLTVVDMSILTGLNNGYISRLETGRNRPSPETAEKLSILFNGVLSEIHLLYPERFPDWTPTAEVLESLRGLKASALGAASLSA